MNSAAAIIEALNARGPKSRLREAARESWTAWLDRWAQRPGRVSGAAVEAIVGELAQREPAPPPPRQVQLDRWRAFATLWRQHWHPASADERRWRWTASGVSFAWHVLVVVLLLIVTALNFVPPAPPQDDTAVQVEYIGQGTPADEGGGPAPAPARTASDESPAAAGGAPPADARVTPDAASAAGSTAAEAPPTPEPPTATPPAPTPPADAVAPTPDPTPVAPPQAAPQPVTVTTPVSPEPPTFTLPPTSVPSPSVEVVRAPAPAVQLQPLRDIAQAPRIEVPKPAGEVPHVAPSPSRVVLREVTAAPSPPAPTVPAPATTANATAPRSPVSTASSAASPSTVAPAVAPGTTAGRATAPSAATGPGAARTDASGPAASTGPRSSTTAGIGTGPKATPAPGSWATPRRGDDWGQSTRDRPGNSLYDGDGRPRLAEGPGSASAAHPPGMLTQEIRDLDRSGTWLKRKPYPYEPTRWDRFWRPNETLLQEWVTKGVKEVGIPIPGTKKKIRCVISILQLGGGCFDISDPNMQDRPATARPPPPVPFKPSLQEGNGATWGTDVPPPPKLPGLFAPNRTGLPPGAAPAPPASSQEPPPKLPGLFAPSNLGTPPSDGKPASGG